MTTKSINSFDSIAWIYDALASLIFGSSIRDAQLHFLKDIHTSQNILVIGGGTGWLLREILQQNAMCTVCYVEASEKMIKRAQKRLQGRARDRVSFLHGTEADLPLQPVFDAIIANFYFDMFPENRIDSVIGSIRKAVSPDAVWLVADFSTAITWWQKFLLWLMYRFFRIVSRIESNTLPDWQAHLQKSGFVEMKRLMFYQGFIQSSVFQNGADERN